MYALYNVQGLASVQQHAEDLATALESSQSDTILLSQALEEAQALLEQRGSQLEAQAAESKVSNYSAGLVGFGDEHQQAELKWQYDRE